MNTKSKGDITESRVIYEFIAIGIPVLIPFGDNQRYDLVVDTSRGFESVQCKTARYRNGCVVFDTCSSYYHRGRKKVSYYDTVDYFATFCEELDEVFIIRAKDVPPYMCSLRVDAPKNRQAVNIRWAKDYKIKNFPP